MLVDTLTRLSISNQARDGTEADLTYSRGRALASSRLEAGHELGPYRLLKWLGRGGEGDIWKAVRLERIRELVALKILKPSLATNPARKAQFRHEAERGTSLIGPSLLTVQELNEVDGYHFIAFDYVEATSLRDIIKRRRDYLSRGELEQGHPFVTMREEDYLCRMTRTLAKAARALASVHDQRIVHRDVKPANILMDNRRSEWVYLCDFGLGRDLDVATLQQMRDGAGTPMYMAPERLMRLTADEIKCDIYSMGVTLCEALTLKRPFRVPHDLPFNSLAPYLAVTEPRRPGALDPQLPEELGTIIMKAMARDPAKRHDSGSEIAAALDRFASDWSSRCRARTLRHPAETSASRSNLHSEPARADSGCVRRSRRATTIQSEFAAVSSADSFSDSGSDR